MPHKILAIALIAIQASFATAQIVPIINGTSEYYIASNVGVSFPIIGTAMPYTSNASGDYYINPSGYAYRYKKILFDSN